MNPDTHTVELRVETPAERDVRAGDLVREAVPILRGLRLRLKASSHVGVGELDRAIGLLEKAEVRRAALPRP